MLNQPWISTHVFQTRFSFFNWLSNDVFKKFLALLCSVKIKIGVDLAAAAAKNHHQWIGWTDGWSLVRDYISLKASSLVGLLLTMDLLRSKSVPGSSVNAIENRRNWPGGGSTHGLFNDFGKTMPRHFGGSRNSREESICHAICFF